MKNKLLEDINVSIVNNTSGESLSLLYSSIHDNLHDIQKKVTTFRNRIILFGLVYILLINGLISFKEILLFPNISISMIQGKLYGFQNMKDLIILMTPLFVTIQYLLLNIMLVGRSILRGGQRILCVKAIPTLEDTVALSVILPMSAGQVLKILTHHRKRVFEKVMKESVDVEQNGLVGKIVEDDGFVKKLRSLGKNIEPIFQIGFILFSIIYLLININFQMLIQWHTVIVLILTVIILIYTYNIILHYKK